MTIGEKIKCFRTLKNMTQKTLGEQTGIGEATIRKYELGIRNPKPLQLKKIAQALNIGENLLLDIPLNTLGIETVGDVMALFFLLESRVGFTYSAKANDDGTIDASTLALHFKNEKVNELISQWLYEKDNLKNRTNFINERKEQFTPEEYNRLTIIDTSLLEVTKQTLMEQKDPLEKAK